MSTQMALAGGFHVKSPIVLLVLPTSCVVFRDACLAGRRYCSEEV
ncbi:hypothetical protein LMG7141_01156 [Ralstonia condita]|uniref:Uncharacterized protein n=1 Tax=Ralstonia condita TaxID=3058600 RepID=A0ABM9J3T1_9RALS|nr:hypothetical protein LMG7141_01156 [Ralstonia sp. LMG 7141]